MDKTIIGVTLRPIPEEMNTYALEVPYLPLMTPNASAETHMREYHALHHLMAAICIRSYALGAKNKTEPWTDKSPKYRDTGCPRFTFQSTISTDNLMPLCAGLQTAKEDLLAIYSQHHPEKEKVKELFDLEVTIVA